MQSKRRKKQGVTRRFFLVTGGMALGGAIAGVSYAVLGRANQSIAETPTNGENNITASEVLVGETKHRNPNPAPKGLYAPKRGDVRIVVISDLNSAYGATDYRDEVKQAIKFLPDWEPDIILCSGDMIAGQTVLTRAQIQAMWDGFEKHIGSKIRATKIPYGFTIGNHDASAWKNAKGDYLFKDERELAAEYWNDPKHDPGLKFVDRAGFPYYYTFEQNDIFYLVWDASTNRVPPEQVVWAEKALASDRAQKAKLRIVIGHLPFYAVAVGREDIGEVLADADQLRAMLEKYNVHTYISGHHHAYYPGHRGKLELLAAGALGEGARPLLDANLPIIRTLTVVDVNFADNSTTYTTYNMNTMEVVNQQILPRMIVGPNGYVVRRDIPEDSLTPEEKNRKFVDPMGL
ncbi:MAG: metallophosphoesterase family protein [Pseudanabaenaceae cyanobacterium]